jgi:hypothetical protein
VLEGGLLISDLVAIMSVSYRIASGLRRGSSVPRVTPT